MAVTRAYIIQCMFMKFCGTMCVNLKNIPFKEIFLSVQ